MSVENLRFQLNQVLVVRKRRHANFSGNCTLYTLMDFKHACPEVHIRDLLSPDLPYHLYSLVESPALAQAFVGLDSNNNYRF